MPFLLKGIAYYFPTLKTIKYLLASIFKWHWKNMINIYYEIGLFNI